MPRIEIVPDGWEESAEAKSGDGTPTIDVCKACAEAWFPEEGIPVPHYLQHQYPKAVLGSVDVEHPNYADGFGPERGDYYACDCCGDTLTNDD